MASRAAASRTFDAVVAGAGITGLACAHALARAGLSVCVVDPNSPMTGTSAYSTECYRDLWSSRPMAKLCRRSIDLLEDLSRDCGDAFGFGANQHGYLFVSREPEHGAGGGGDSSHPLLSFASDISQNGGGPVRQFRKSGKSGPSGPNSHHQETLRPYSSADKHGLDMVWGQEAISQSFPHVRAESALHARRAGWIDSQQLGTVLLEGVVEAGGVLMVGSTVCGMTREAATGAVQGVRVRARGEQEVMDICARHFVNAAGPFAGELHDALAVSGVFGGGQGRCLPFGGVQNLGMHNELHAKVIFKDHHGVVPSDSPMVILADQTTLEWDVDELDWVDELRQSPELAKEANMQDWVQPGLPPGCHIRPASNGWCVMLWEHAHQGIRLNHSVNVGAGAGAATGQPPPPPRVHDPTMPDFYDAHIEPLFNPMYPEFAMRAMSSAVPGLFDYVGKLGRRDAFIDGGYYSYAPDQLPIVGPVEGVEGYHVATGMAGFGIMAAMGVGDIILESIQKGRSSEPAFCPSRLSDIGTGPGKASGTAIGGSL